MKKLIPALACLCGLAVLTACTTVKPNTIREVNEGDVKRCKLAGPVHGADAVFVGLSAGAVSSRLLRDRRTFRAGVSLRAVTEPEAA